MTVVNGEKGEIELEKIVYFHERIEGKVQLNAYKEQKLKTITSWQITRKYL